MDIERHITHLYKELSTKQCKLLIVTKSQPLEKIQIAYNTGHRAFGENKVQELISKREALPKNIQWHMIGHLQTNKVKHIVPFISLIHSVDSPKLLGEISRQGRKINRIIPCLLQMHIAREESKFGMNKEEAENTLKSIESYPFVQIKGLMGMATFTDDQHQITGEFSQLKKMYDTWHNTIHHERIAFDTLSMGMSTDYTIAMKEGSTLVRIGSAIFR